ncbi:MAG: hypothetical protein KAI77_06320 [Gammaproteobacteria bacterium]|nr:hypothetical protein [Gammaproteobacteria bacterium]
MTIESAPTLIRYMEELSELAVTYQKDNSSDSLDAVTQKLEEAGTYAGDQNMHGFQDVCFFTSRFFARDAGRFSLQGYTAAATH